MGPGGVIKSDQPHPEAERPRYAFTQTDSDEDSEGTITDKEVTTTTFTQSDITSTKIVYVTENDGTTITPSPAIKTSVLKATTTTSSIVTEADSTTTLKSTETVFTTVSVAGKDSVIKSTSTIFSTSSYTPKPSTVKATTTIVIVSTSTPKATTITDNEGGVQTVYETSTQKAKTISSTISLSGAQVVKTSTVAGDETREDSPDEPPGLPQGHHCCHDRRNEAPGQGQDDPEPAHHMHSSVVKGLKDLVKNLRLSARRRHHFDPPLILKADQSGKYVFHQKERARPGQDAALRP